MARALRGYVDIVEPTRIKGWAHDPDAPERALVLELCEGDQVLCTIVARELRPDLRDAGIGTGLYGFTFSLTPRLFPLARHVLRVRFAETGLDLQGSPCVLEPMGPQAPFDADAATLSTVLDKRLRAARSAEELGRFVETLAGALDLALLQRDRVGRPVIAPSAPVASGPPASFREAVASICERYPEIVLEPVRKPVVSVVIVSCDQFAEAHGCIRALAADLPAAPMEVILVDDQSTDETLIGRAVLPAAVRIFRVPQRAGEARALRAGHALAQGRYVLFLDPRVRLARGAVDALVKVFEGDPDAGATGPVLLGDKGRIAAAGYRLARSGDMEPLGEGLAADDPDVFYRHEVDALHPAALMMDRTLWTRTGGVDEDYPDLPHAGADLCLRIRKAGRKIILAHDARATFPLHPDTLVPEDDAVARGRLAHGRRRLGEVWAETLAAPGQGRQSAAGAVAKRALVIDHAFPTPHRDAGSGAMVSHIAALESLGYAVSFVPGGPPDRHPTGTALLQAMGVRTYHAPHMQGPADVLERIGTSLDLVYIHRFPNAKGYLEIVRRFAPQARVVFSVADLHFLREERQAELEGKDQRSPEIVALREAELDIVRRVDSVITHSEAEAVLLREAAPETRVFVVPWSVPARPVTRPFSERSGIAFVGSYGHAPNRDAANWLVTEIMPLVHRTHPDITLHLVGAGLPEDLAHDRPGIRALGWVEDLHEQVFSRVRLTVAPLRFGAGLKGKVLESLAAGVPCVMTGCAAEGLPEMTQIHRWTVKGAEGFARAIIEEHEGGGATPESVDEVRKTISNLTDAQFVANLLENAISKPSLLDEDQQRSAPLLAQRE